MLLVIIGVSCVGKTTVMNILNEKYKWKFVQIYTTRESRGNDNKLHISKEDFRTKLLKKEIAFPNSFYGCQYGCKRSDILKSQINNSSVFMLDFGVENIFQLSFLSHVKKIILIPESLEQLERQITKSSRLSRKNEIINQYKSSYADISYNTVIQGDFFLIENIKNNPVDTATRIFNVVNKK